MLTLPTSIENVVEETNYQPCEYIDFENVADIKDYTIIHWNIQSTPSKFDLLKHLVTQTETPAAIIGLCETFLHKQNRDSYHINGYDHYSTVRSNKKRGGVSLYVYHTVRSKERADLNYTVEGIIESIVVEIERKGKPNILVCELYRIPNSNFEIFYDTVKILLDKIKVEHKEFVLLTDQNLNLINCDHKNTFDFVELTLVNGLIATIKLPTRITTNTATLIDNIYISKNLVYNASYVVECDYSDHYPCILTFSGALLSNKIGYEKRLKRSINQTKLDLVKHDLLSLHVDQNGNSEIETTKFVNTVNKVLDRHLPVTFKRYKNVDDTAIWLNSDVMEKLRNRRKAYKKFKSGKTSKEDYCKIRNESTRSIKFEKIKFFRSRISEHRNNSRTLWNIISHAIRKCKNKKSFPGSFKKDGKMLLTKSEICNEFAMHYAGLGAKYADQIIQTRNPNKMYQPLKNLNPNTDTIFLNPTTEDEVKKCIENLKPKSSAGIDSISNRLIILLKEVLIKPITSLINLSYEQGIFPGIFKTAKVIPLYKSGNKSEIVNYRPISLLPCISKIFEKTMLTRLIEFSGSCNLLYEGQYGFRKNRGTIDACTDFIGNTIEFLEKDMYVCGVFLDMSKAFDTLSHDILLKKLDLYGIRGKAFKWLESYLSDRKLYVEIENCKSTSENITTGSPQGANLSPFLYILYTNCITKYLKFSNVVLFVDDTSLIIAGKNVKSLKAKVTKDLELLKEYFDANLLTVNLDKTCIILFRKPNWDRPTLDISVNDISIKQVECVKFLGMYVDETLSWKQHTVMLKNKLLKGMYGLRNSKNLLDVHTRKLVYFAFIHSHLQYGITLWSQCCKKNFNLINQKQIDALKIVFNTKSKTECISKMKEHSIPTLENLNNIELSKLSFRYTHQLISIRIKNLFEQRSHTYKTRNMNMPKQKFSKSKFYHNTFLSKCPPIWQNLPPNIKNKERLSCFKSICKKHFCS